MTTLHIFASAFDDCNKLILQAATTAELRRLGVHGECQVQLDVKLDAMVWLVLVPGVGDCGMAHGQHKNV